MKNKTPKRFYHISRKNHGNVFTFVPRVPDSAVVEREGNIPRVCVAPSLYCCIASIVSGKDIKVGQVLCEFAVMEPFETVEEFEKSKRTIPFPSVYWTHDQPYLPPASSDFRRNKEHWFISPTTMLFEGYLDLQSLWSFGILRLTQSAGVLPADCLATNSSVLIKK